MKKIQRISKEIIENDDSTDDEATNSSLPGKKGATKVRRSRWGPNGLRL